MRPREAATFWYLSSRVNPPWVHEHSGTQPVQRGSWAVNAYQRTETHDGEGRALILRREWSEALNTQFHYQLTAIGAEMPDLHIESEIQNGEFVIAGGKPGLRVSWQVAGTRQDAYSLANPFVLERE